MEQEPKWGVERGDVTVDDANNVWTNLCQEDIVTGVTKGYACIAGCGAVSSIPSNPARPEWGWLCSNCANAPVRRGSHNSTGFCVLHDPPEKT
jgi:hypothetical protein